MEYDIVCVAQPSWDGPYAKSTVLLMKEISAFHRVLYVDYASTWKDFVVSLLQNDFAKAFRMLGFRDRITKKGDHIHVLTLPPILPLNFLPPGKFYSLINRLNGRAVSKAIRRATRELKFNNLIVINAFAPALGLGTWKQLDEKATLYYCYDEITQAEWSNKHGGVMEAAYAGKSDAIIVSSEALKEDKSELSTQVFIVKNGVDGDLFRPGEGVLSNKKPVVGFVGSLDSRIDYDLLDQVVSSSPDLIFRFVGRVVDARFEILRNRQNVEWIAPLPYQELPKVIQQFDVGIIPFVKSEFTRKIYPLKINEYLAMGKPVVRTSFAVLPEFDSVTGCADTAIDFKKEIDSQLAMDNDEKSAHRCALAQKNSWKERAKSFCEIIDLVLHEKN